MKKKNDKKSLPKFKAVTLGPDELSKAVGGLECTCGTVSVCHVDGTDDGDGDLLIFAAAILIARSGTTTMAMEICAITVWPTKRPQLKRLLGVIPTSI